MRGIFFVKSHPDVGAVAHCVRARLLQDAANRVSSTRDIILAFDVRESGDNEHRQDRDDGDDYEQFKQRKSGTLERRRDATTRLR